MDTTGIPARAEQGDPDEPFLGLESGTVRVVEYRVQWPRLFDRCRRELQGALGSRVLEIHHVGSTAVRGLAAKPILDILVGVEDLARAKDLVPELEALGYEYRPDEEIPDRHYFRRPRGVGRARTHHLSLAVPGSNHFSVTIAFRDALRADGRLAEQYEEIKRALAARYPEDRAAYISGKASFIQHVLESVAPRRR